MILTEADASKKQCRICGPIPASVGGRVQIGGQPQIGFLTCGGSACCHWRWKDPLFPDGGGYCGLAGQPAGVMR